MVSELVVGSDEQDYYNNNSLFNQCKKKLICGNRALNFKFAQKSVKILDVVLELVIGCDEEQYVHIFK